MLRPAGGTSPAMTRKMYEPRSSLALNPGYAPSAASPSSKVPSLKLSSPRMRPACAVGARRGGDFTRLQAGRSQSHVAANRVEAIKTTDQTILRHRTRCLRKRGHVYGHVCSIGGGGFAA